MRIATTMTAIAFTLISSTASAALVVCGVTDGGVGDALPNVVGQVGLLPGTCPGFVGTVADARAVRGDDIGGFLFAGTFTGINGLLATTAQNFLGGPYTETAFVKGTRNPAVNVAGEFFRVTGVVDALAAVTATWNPPLPVSASKTMKGNIPKGNAAESLNLAWNIGAGANIVVPVGMALTLSTSDCPDPADFVCAISPGDIVNGGFLVTPAPEPATLALLVVGFVAAGFARRRKLS